MKRASLVLVTLASFAAALIAVPACEDVTADHACTGIPAGGCPLSRGVACEDPACESVYACRPGNVWELDHKCPAHEASVPREASTDAPAEVSRPFDASADAPPGANGGPGCGPLQTPDCTLAFALSCPSGCCDCEDLFVCQNGGWTYWATCKP